MTSSFEAERAKFVREVEGVAADLLKRGQCGPGDAMSKAREIVLERRRHQFDSQTAQQRRAAREGR